MKMKKSRNYVFITYTKFGEARNSRKCEEFGISVKRRAAARFWGVGG
jgi:hypothetical protein